MDIRLCCAVVAAATATGVCTSCLHTRTPVQALSPATAAAAELPPEGTTASQARELCAARLAAAMPALTGDDLPARRQAEQPLQALCWRAGRPGAAAERRGVSTALADALAGDLPVTTQLFLIKQLGSIGRAEAVPALTACLERPDEGLRDAARRALAANPTAPAARALRARLKAADDDAKAPILQALLYRQDRRDVDACRRAVQSGPEALCRVGLDGLATLGTPADAALLRETMVNGPLCLRPVATDAYLRLADTLCADGQRTAALGLYRQLLEDSGPPRDAAIIGLGRAGGAAELPDLIALLGDDDAEARGAARSALALLPADDVVPALTAALDTAMPQMRVALLQALATSRVPAVRAALTAAVAEGDEATRLAAIAGLGTLADPRAAPALAQVVATEGEPLLEAARNALALIAGDEVAAALTAAFPAATPAGRRALLAALATRRGEPTVAFLCQCAASDPDTRVRQEALRGLCRVAGPEAVADLLRLLLAAPTDDECGEASLAIAAAARRGPDPTAAAATVLAGLAGAPPLARARLLRALGRLGGEQALAAVRLALADPDPAVQETAVRSLAEWPDQDALDELLRLAANAPETRHRILALRGYVRLVREPGVLAPAAQFARLDAAMAVASRPEDRRLVLAGLGEVADPAALGAALTCLGAPETASEAAAAVLAVVERLRWRCPQECIAALDQVAVHGPTDAERAKAASRRDDLRRYEGHFRLWLLAGPYTKAGATREQLHGAVFPPEQDPPPEAVDWQVAYAGEPGEPSWFVPLDQLLKGNQRVAYLRTWFRTPGGPARLEVGTDDACKAWLNGSVVIDQNVDRALAPAQDTPEVTLRSGWNCLVLKVTQNSGEWSAAARVCAPAGGPLPGLVAMADPEAVGLAVADLAQAPQDAAALQAGLDLTRAAAGSPQLRRTLLAALASAGTPAVATEARERLTKLDACEDYLARWEVAGPYEQTGVEGPGLLDIAFAPELTDGKAPAWQPAPTTPGQGAVPVVDLAKLLGGNHRVAYLRGRVVAAKAQPVQVELGSDDAVKVWLNGRLVHRNPADRPVRPGEDKLPAELQAGENTVLMKITQGTGGWGACLRFRTPAGGHLDDVHEASP